MDNKKIIFFSLKYLTLCDPINCSLCPWNFPGKNTGVARYSLFQGTFLTQGLNLGLPHCKQILHRLSHQGSPKYPRKLNMFSLFSLPILDRSFYWTSFGFFIQ